MAVAALLVWFPAWGPAANLAPRPAASAARLATQAPPRCPWDDLTFAALMKSRSFKLGQPVVMTSLVTNHDSHRCSIVVGYDHGRDPSQIVLKHGGKFVWDACDLDNKAGACSQLWMLQTLAPGASYRLASTWNQTWGPGARKSGQVPAGRYKFGSGYTDLIHGVLHNASASVRFRIR